MFNIDSKTKQEAVNYAALLNALNCTERRLEPKFEELGCQIPVNEPMDEPEIGKAYSDFFEIEESKLLREYHDAWKAFSELKPDDAIVKRGSLEYPELLAGTKQAPRFLYIRGNSALLHDRRAVALVGSRQASDKGKNNTRRLAVTLGRNGIIIVSGLARGIDVSAHTAAMDNGFHTVAVIGTNLNQYYPAENKEVQLEIERRGAVVSPFAPSNRTQRWFFPLRNGVMSGLSLATVIMEAGERSGALRQAEYALQQNRQVIIPMDVYESEKVTWPQKYVKKGARTAESPMDVLRILADNPIFENERMQEPSQLSFENAAYETEKADRSAVNMDLLQPVLLDGQNCR